MADFALVNKGKSRWDYRTYRSVSAILETGLAGLVSPADEGQHLLVGVADDEARGGLLDGPGRREAASKLSTPHHPIRDEGSDEFLGGFW
jgi:hypothetical protein